MTQKNISLTEKAYLRLKELKRKEESFSDLIIRITEPEKKASLDSLFGIGKGDDDWSNIEKTIKENKSKVPENRIRFD